MRRKLLSLLLCGIALLAFSACSFLGEKADEIGEQVERMREQYDDLQQLYGDMQDLLLASPQANDFDTQFALIGIESKLQTYESILENEPEEYHDLEGLREIEREMQSTREQMETAIETGSLRGVAEQAELPGSAGEFSNDNLASQKTMRILELMTEISAAMKPGDESWDAAYRDLNVRYQQFSMEIDFEAYENGAPGNAQLLEQLDEFIAEYEEMLAGIG